MSDTTRPTDKEEAKQERGALLVTLATAAVIAVVGAPCFCYFGIGLFQGVHVLHTGQTTNPARQTQRGKNYQRPAQYERSYKRPTKYDRTFDASGEPTPAQSSDEE